MDNRGYQSRNFGFIREVRPHPARVHPNDDENDAISVESIDRNPSPHPVSQLK